MVSLPGQALAAQTLSIKGREGRVKEMGVMSSSVHSPGDHVEESLPLPPDHLVIWWKTVIHREGRKNRNLETEFRNIVPRMIAAFVSHMKDFHFERNIDLPIQVEFDSFYDLMLQMIDSFFP